MPPFLKRALVGLLIAISAALAASAVGAPLNVSGRFLQDAHGNTIQIRGVNVPAYKSGYADDLDAVAATVALTRANAVRFEWWSNPPAGTTEYTLAHFDRAIQKYFSYGMITIVELHDLTFAFGHDDKAGPNSDGNDRTVFANAITAYWTRPDVLNILRTHNDHIILNIANEWGSSFYSDGTPTTANFIANYTDAIAALRNAGITAPLMIDAPKGFEYRFMLDHGAALLAADPLHNTLLSVHAYWATADPAYSDANLNAIVDAFVQSGLPIVFGETSSNAYTAIPCDPIHYGTLLTRVNANGFGYVFWAWYEDGQCGQEMNITVNGDGVTRPTMPGFGYDALYAPGYGIDAAIPATRKADFSPVVVTGADLSISQVANVDPVTTGRDAIFAITVTNNGPLAATGVTVTASYDASTAGIWASPQCGQGPGASYVCTAGRLAVGASAQFSVVLRKGVVGSITNIASASASTADPASANNSSALTIGVVAAAAAVPTARYRLYSPITLEHHFTTDANEYAVLPSFGWVPEGTVGKVLNNPGSFNGAPATPYYRLYNTITRWHHWTTDPNEYYTLGLFEGWNQEGVDGYILPTAPAGTMQLYRLTYPFVPGLHHWTVDSNEYATLVSTFGWVGEGGSGFVVQ